MWKSYGIRVMSLINKAIEQARREKELHYLKFALNNGISPSRANFICRQAAMMAEDLEYHRGVLKIKK